MLKQNSICKGRETSQYPVFQQLVSTRLLQMCILAIVQKPSQGVKEAEIPFLH